MTPRPVPPLRRPPATFPGKSTNWLHRLTTAAPRNCDRALFRPRRGMGGGGTLGGRTCWLTGLLLDGLGVDLDRHLLADEDTAGLEGLVPGEAERLTVQLRL